jgi:acyl carrier protein
LTIAHKKIDINKSRNAPKKRIGFDSLDLAELTVRIKAVCDIDIYEDGIKKKLFQIKLSLCQISSN